MKQKIQIILAFILGIVVSSGVVYAVTLYQAKEVAYDNTSSDSTSTDVQSAIDELYDITNTLKNLEVEVLKNGNNNYGTNSSGSLTTSKDYKAIIVTVFALNTRGGGSAGSRVTTQDGTSITASTNQSLSFWGATPNKGDMDGQVYTHVYLNVPSGSTVSYTANANQRTGSTVIGIL